MATIHKKIKGLYIIRRFGPIKKALFTRKMYQSFDDLSLARLRKLVNNLANAGLICVQSEKHPGQPGPVPTTLSITRKGREWLDIQLKETKGYIKNG